jgi:hypothetical protein
VLIFLPRRELWFNTTKVETPPPAESNGGRTLLRRKINEIKSE